jgi:uroporphyrinogen decarboxylase
MGVSEALIYCFEEPDMVHMVLEKAVQFLIKYYNAYKETGAAGIVMAEPLAGLLSEDMAKEFSAEYVKKIVAEVQTDDFIIVYHNCGNSTISTIDTIIGNGCKVFHFGNAIDMKEMMKHIPSDKIAMGNVDPAGEFRNGTPESVYNKTIEIMEKCSPYPNFIISSGCDIPPMSPWDNIKSFFKAVEAYNNR